MSTAPRLTELNNAIGEIQDMTKKKEYRPLLDHAWDQFMQALTKLRNLISKYISSAQHTPATSSYSGIFKPKFYEDAAKVAEKPETAKPRPAKK